MPLARHNHRLPSQIEALEDGLLLGQEDSFHLLLQLDTLHPDVGRNQSLAMGSPLHHFSVDRGNGNPAIDQALNRRNDAECAAGNAQSCRYFVDCVIDGALGFDLRELLVKQLGFRDDFAGGEEVMDFGEEQGDDGEPLGIVFLFAGEGDGVLPWRGCSARYEG